MANKRTTRKIQKSVTRATKTLAKSHSGRVTLVFIALLLVVAIAFGAWWFYFRKPEQTTPVISPDAVIDNNTHDNNNANDDPQNNDDEDEYSCAYIQAYPAVSDQDISIHFLEVGNHYTGDCVYIKTETCDILIDCGSRLNSLPTITDYLSHYVTDGVFEYVILTHAHQDHIAGFAAAQYNNSFFGAYSVEVFIDSATLVTTAVYNRYVTNLEKAVTEHGTTHYTALQCINETDGAQTTYAVGGGYTMTILDTEYYETPSSNENNNSVCCLFSNGTRNYLLTGDLEQEGEESLIERNTLPHVDLFKAGHHGSYTASSAALMAVIQPKTVVVCCCAGDDEYTSDNAKQFPSQQFVNNVAPYTSEIYVTTLNDESVEGKHVSFNGNVVYMSKGSVYKVACSASATKLQDSEWFHENRVLPT